MFLIVILEHGSRTKDEFKLPTNIKMQYTRKEEAKHHKISVFVGINGTQIAGSHKRGRVNSKKSQA